MATKSDRNTPFEVHNFWPEAAFEATSLDTAFETSTETKKRFTEMFSDVLPVKPQEATKFDDNKLDWTLVPYDALEEVVRVLSFGAVKYNEKGRGPSTWNWSKGTGLGKWRTLAAILRHLTAYLKGEVYDPETKLNHMAHVCCGALFLLSYHKNSDKYPEFKE